MSVKHLNSHSLIFAIAVEDQAVLYLQNGEESIEKGRDLRGNR